MQHLIKHIQSKDIESARRRYLERSSKMSRRDQLFFAALLDQMEGKFSASKNTYEILLNEFPRDQGGVVNLAALHNDNNSFKEALRIINQNFENLNTNEINLVKFDSFFGLNELDNAETVLLKISSDFHSKPSYLERKAALKIRQKKAEEAIIILEELIDLNIGNKGSIFSNLSAAYNKLGEYERAYQYSEMATEINPSSWQSKLNQATSLLSLERYSESKLILEKLLLDGKRDQEILINMARITSLIGEVESSISFCKEGLINDPNDKALLTCMADNLSILQKHTESYDFYEKVLKLEPENDLANWHFALALLRDGQYSRGWEQYKWGFKRKTGGRGEYKFDKSDEWNNRRNTKSLTVWGEQGIGDQLMFAKFLRYIPLEIQKIELQVEAKMVPVLQDRLISRSGIEVVPYSSHPVGIHIPVGNLPSLLWNDYSADSNRLSPFLIRKYNRQPSSQIRIGITWRGGKTERMQSKRSVPLGLFPRIKILKNKNIKIIQLQYNPLETEINYLQNNFGNKLSLPKYDATKELNLWIDHIDSCDLLISVDNSAVHFAGAMGIPTLAMIPSHPDFRWGLSGSSNQWYASVELFRDFAALSLDDLAIAIDNWVLEQITNISGG